MEGIPSGSGSNELFLIRQRIYDIIKSSNMKSIDKRISFLISDAQNVTRCPKHMLPQLNRNIYRFTSDFKSRWLKSNRKEKRFLEANREWLLSSLSFPKYSTQTKINRGRPDKTFENLSERSKRQKTQLLRTENSSKELAYAAQMSLRSSGSVDAAKVIKDVTMTTPKRAVRYRTGFKQTYSEAIRKLSSSEALSLFIDANLTKTQYNKIRRKDYARFPSYKVIQRTKKECYPDPASISVDEIAAEVKLQALMDHTSQRIAKLQEEVIKNQEGLRNLCLIWKWGFDGSNQAEYKQKFSKSESSDASIFITSLVPLRLEAENENNETLVIWQNTRTSSTRFCRPIKFQFARETKDLSKAEKAYIDGENVRIEINHKLLFTIVDGKVCNAITETTSTQRCYICGLTSKDFNNLTKVLDARVDENHFSFGLSILHARIRSLECLLNVSYRLSIKIWQARGGNKAIVAQRQKLIQKQFKEEIGLTIDKPKQGFGSSNDGNTARRFFNDPEKTSEITGLNLRLIQRFKTILETLASGHLIDTVKFKEYAAKINLYDWYPMPPTVHKILIHGADIIANFLLPIGELSEEVQEANHKIFKIYREGFSRKMSREKTNMDVLNRLFIGSDPVISSLEPPSQTRKPFNKEVLGMLLPSDVKVSEYNLSESSSSDSE